MFGVTLNDVGRQTGRAVSGVFPGVPSNVLGAAGARGADTAEWFVPAAGEAMVDLSRAENVLDPSGGGSLAGLTGGSSDSSNDPESNDPLVPSWFLPVVVAIAFLAALGSVLDLGVSVGGGS